MARSDLAPILDRIDLLAGEISNYVPISPATLQFRGDLAGLLVVAIAASYESCVKETMVNYAARHHVQFEIFAQNNFEKLNSRINLSDLHRYAKSFDNSIHQKFGELIVERRRRLNTKIGKDFTKSYGQILSWRHDFAHAGKRNTTVKEALATHRLAKRVMYTFDEAFA